MDGSRLRAGMCVCVRVRACVRACIRACEVGSIFTFQRLCVPEKDWRSTACSV